MYVIATQEIVSLTGAKVILKKIVFIGSNFGVKY
jgi:hypothetical protein